VGREARLRGLAAELATFADEGPPVRDAVWWADQTTGPSSGRPRCGTRPCSARSRPGCTGPPGPGGQTGECAGHPGRRRQARQEARLAWHGTSRIQVR